METEGWLEWPGLQVSWEITGSLLKRVGWDKQLGRRVDGYLHGDGSRRNSGNPVSSFNHLF